MRAMVLREPAPAESRPLEPVERAVPQAGPGELLVRVEVCGVCRTDLHVIEGDLGPDAQALVPGHQVVGRVASSAPAGARFRVGDRVGIAWLRRPAEAAASARAGTRTSASRPRFTGWDADGGYAE